MPKIKTQMKVDVKGPGFQQLLADIAGAEITVGVHGEEGAKMHSDTTMSVGELMAMHELGLGGQKERSWLRHFLDANQSRYHDAARASLQRILRGASRKKETEALGYMVTEEMRENITSGKISPPLAQATIDAKGHDIPLLESAEGVNAITFKLKLKRVAAIADKGVRAALRGRR